MKEGKLFLDSITGRDIRYPDYSEYGGLHCGNVIDIMVDGKWKARIEYNDASGWYFIGCDIPPELAALRGLPVRI